MTATSLVLHSTWKLSRLRLRLWWNSIKHSSWRRRIGYAAAALGILGFGVFLLVASWGILKFLSNPQISDAMQQAGFTVDLAGYLDQLPVLFSLGAFLVGVFTSFGVLLQSLYLSGDMEFLLAAPLPPRAVFASKLIQAILPSLFLMALFSAPALVGLGLSQGYHWLYYPLVPVTLTLLIASGAGLSAILVMVVVRLASPRRAAEILGLLGGLIGLICSQSGQIANQVEVSPDQMVGVFGVIGCLNTLSNPLAWPGHGLSLIGRQQWASGIAFTTLSLFLMLGMLAIAMVAAERMYLNGWSRVQVSDSARRKTAARAERRARAGAPARLPGRLLPPPVLALVAKDVRLYRRDIRNLSQLVMPILLAVIWTFTLLGRGQDQEIPAGAQLFLRMGTMWISIFVGWMFAMRFAMGGLSMEGRQWWILKSAPMRTGHLILAKYLIALIPSAGLSLAYLLVADIIRGIDPGTIFYQAVAVLAIMGAECSLLLAFGIWTARFDWDNPREISGGLGGCLGSLAAVAFLAVATGLMSGLPLLAGILGWPETIGIALGFSSGMVVCALVGIIPIWLARQKIPQLGEI